MCNFMKTFSNFLQPEDETPVKAADFMESLVGNGKKSQVVANTLLLFLKVLLGSNNESYKIPHLKLDLADLPLTQHTISYHFDELAEDRSQVAQDLYQTKRKNDVVRQQIEQRRIEEAKKKIAEAHANGTPIPASASGV